ncbi:hypothetical protein LCGC14_2312200 [marine sediment metagenome]|uniref:Uncharacterized protein n=1 Tax=marine sediment metagenome TaxID=412755 RepID=A0A0F9CKX3_9ZZZZ
MIDSKPLEIVITKDKLFRAIQELKEVKKNIPADIDNLILKRHNLMIQKELLDKILMTGGIDFLLEKLEKHQNKLKLVNAVKKQNL